MFKGHFISFQELTGENLSFYSYSNCIWFSDDKYQGSLLNLTNLYPQFTCVSQISLKLEMQAIVVIMQNKLAPIFKAHYIYIYNLKNIYEFTYIITQICNNKMFYQWHRESL